MRSWSRVWAPLPKVSRPKGNLVLLCAAREGWGNGMSWPELQKQSGHRLVALPDLAASKNPPEAVFTSAPALQERRNLTAATLLQARITWEPAVVPGLSRAATLGGWEGGGSWEEYHRDCSKKARVPHAVTWPELSFPRHRPLRPPAGTGKLEAGGRGPAHPLLVKGEGCNFHTCKATCSHWGLCLGVRAEKAIVITFPPLVLREGLIIKKNHYI